MLLIKVRSKVYQLLEAHVVINQTCQFAKAGVGVQATSRHQWCDIFSASIINAQIVICPVTLVTLV